jgi:hypothetical protein
MSRTTLGAFLATGLLALAGCGGTDQITEQAVEEASGGEVKIDKDGDKTKIEVAGQELENQQGSLVDGFPEDFPMPDDFEVETSTKTQGKYQAFGSIPSSDETFAFYKDKLAGDGGTSRWPAPRERAASRSSPTRADAKRSWGRARQTRART